MKKHLRITWNAPVVLSIVAVSFAATLLNYLTGGRSGMLLFMTYHSSLLLPMTWIRMFTHIFGHADWSHLIGNMSYLLLLGPMLEEKYSSRVLFRGCPCDSVCDGTGKLYPFPATALCGASGVVFAFILLSSFTNFREGEIPVTFILVAVLFIGQQVWDGITIRDNISHMTHIIGGMIGGMIGYGLNCKSRFE